ncbi:hypothetical protein DXG01_012220 [Tephrocybe rancida]|nr:hypothetical protein DXG01_012220 [Tephrocybe rancida]
MFFIKKELSRLSEITLFAAMPFALFAVLADIFIALSLVVLLWGSRTGFRRTNTLVNILIVYAINRCVLTSVVAVAEVIAFAVSPHSLWFLAIDFVVGKLYANSLLATLNSRHGMRNGNMVNSVHMSDIHFEEPSLETGRSTQKGVVLELRDENTTSSGSGTMRPSTSGSDSKIPFSSLPPSSSVTSMSSKADLQWKGYAIHDTKNWDKFKVIDFEPKRAEDYDVDIKIEYCGVCGSDGDLAHGGYSTAVRAHERFVFPLPKELPLEEIAPMLCAGLTVYSPLVRNGTGPGKRVGVIGIGGLGHFAIQFARALGAEQVVAFSHSKGKEDDARKLGATDVVITASDDFAKPWAGKLDLIICTADVSQGIPLSDYMTILRVHGRLIMVAIPDDKLPPLHSSEMVGNGALLGGSHIGSKKEALEMLDLAVKKGVKSWIELLPMKEAGKAVRGVKDNTVRYRHVLKVDI